MLLVEDGRLSLADRAVNHLDGAPEAWSGISIRHLLMHTSGLRREGPGFNPLLKQSDAQVIACAYEEALLFPPGDAMQYSNLGYYIPAEIIGKVSGIP